MKRFMFPFFVLLLISSIIYGQENASNKVKKMTFMDAASSAYVIKGGDPKSDSRNARVEKAIKDGLKGKSFILATLPEDCPDAIIEDVKKLKDDKIVILTDEKLKTIPMVDGKRKTTFNSLLKLGASAEQLAVLEAEPGECLEPPFYTATCRCSGYLLMVEQIPVNHCSDTCFPMVGLYIMCASPCWTVYVPCTN